MKKIFSLMVVMLLGATSLMAQNPDKGWSFAAETGIGTEWQLGARAQYNFNEYIAVEGNARYAFDWDKTKIWGATFKTNWNEISITAGARGFSPKFGPDMKAYANFGIGYGAMFGGDMAGNTNCFAIDFGVGMYLWKGLYAGYGLDALCNGGSHVDHVVRIGYNFEF